ncbi:26S proteasome non-ATPase regulatory subunit 4 [Tanacetum coccineum]
MEPVTVICIDNSFLLNESWAGDFYIPQAEAIELYSEEKIKAHPCNGVGLLAMGFIQEDGFIKPTRDLDQIRFALKGLTYSSQSCIPIGHVLTFFLNSNLPKRRLLVFSGGRLSMDSALLEFYATRLKEFKVAVDVVNFGLQSVPPQMHKLLEAFVKAADNDGNSRYLYAPSGSTTSLGQQILCTWGSSNARGEEKGRIRGQEKGRRRRQEKGKDVAEEKEKDGAGVKEKGKEIGSIGLEKRRRNFLLL